MNNRLDKRFLSLLNTLQKIIMDYAGVDMDNLSSLSIKRAEKDKITDGMLMYILKQEYRLSSGDTDTEIIGYYSTNVFLSEPTGYDKNINRIDHNSTITFDVVILDDKLGNIDCYMPIPSKIIAVIPYGVLNIENKDNYLTIGEIYRSIANGVLDLYEIFEDPNLSIIENDIVYQMGHIRRLIVVLGFLATVYSENLTTMCHKIIDEGGLSHALFADNYTIEGMIFGVAKYISNRDDISWDHDASTNISALLKEFDEGDADTWADVTSCIDREVTKLVNEDANRD